MTKQQAQNYNRLEARLLDLAPGQLTPADVATLIRAERTLHHWAVQECGDGNDYASWSIERDEATGVPYRCVYPHRGAMHKERIADREAGALRRVAAICTRTGLYYYHQDDPRGCALYIDAAPLTNSGYNRGVAVCY